MSIVPAISGMAVATAAAHVQTIPKRPKLALCLELCILK